MCTMALDISGFNLINLVNGQAGHRMSRFYSLKKLKMLLGNDLVEVCFRSEVPARFFC